MLLLRSASCGESVSGRNKNGKIYKRTARTCTQMQIDRSPVSTRHTTTSLAGGFRASKKHFVRAKKKAVRMEGESEREQEESTQKKKNDTPRGGRKAVCR